MASKQPFDTVKEAGLTLPNVEASIRYDGSPVLKVFGVFMASISTHPSAEPNSLVVRSSFDDRERLLEEAPETYYITAYYRRHPVVLARLSCLDREALHDLLSSSWRLTMAKVKKGTSPNPSRSRTHQMP